MPGGNVEKMLVVGLIWGATNALMRRGAQIWDLKLRFSPTASQPPPRRRPLLGGAAGQWLDLLLTWQYSLPFLANLSASAAFFHTLSDSPISVAVPVTNAVTFASTAVAAAILGEQTRLIPAAFGTALIILGVWICIT